MINLKKYFLWAFLVLVGVGLTASIFWNLNSLLKIEYSVFPEIKIPQTAQEWIGYYSKIYGNEKYPYKKLKRLSGRVAFCESGFKNVKGRFDNSVGIFQFLKSTFSANCTGDIWSVRDNASCGVRLISEGKIYHWGTRETWWGSFRCWSKEL